MTTRTQLAVIFRKVEWPVSFSQHRICFPERFLIITPAFCTNESSSCPPPFLTWACLCGFVPFIVSTSQREGRVLLYISAGVVLVPLSCCSCVAVEGVCVCLYSLPSLSLVFRASVPPLSISWILRFRQKNILLFSTFHVVWAAVCSSGGCSVASIPCRGCSARTTRRLSHIACSTLSATSRRHLPWCVGRSICQRLFLVTPLCSISPRNYFVVIMSVPLHPISSSVSSAVPHEVWSRSRRREAKQAEQLAVYVPRHAHTSGEESTLIFHNKILGESLLIHQYIQSQSNIDLSRQSAKRRQTMTFAKHMHLLKIYQTTTACYSCPVYHYIFASRSHQPSQTGADDP